MKLVLTQNINDTKIDGYTDGEAAWFTREQIGLALGYSDPGQSVTNIHNRHKDRFEKNSVQIKLISTDGKAYETYLYNLRGVFEICRWSKQPRADEVMNKLYDMAVMVMQKGYYSVLPDDKLLELLVDKYCSAEHPNSFMYDIRPAALKERVREKREEQSLDLFERRKDYTYQQYHRELLKIWGEDTRGFSKEWRKRFNAVCELPYEKE